MIGFPLDRVSPGTGRRHGRIGGIRHPRGRIGRSLGPAWSGRFLLRGSGHRSPLRFTLASPVFSPWSFPAVHIGLPPGRFTPVAPAGSPGSLPLRFPGSLHPGRFLRFTLAFLRVVSPRSLLQVPPDRFLCDSPGRFIRVTSCGSHWHSPGRHPDHVLRFTLASPSVASPWSFPAVHIASPPRPFPALPGPFPGLLPPVMSRSPQVAHPGLAGINPFHRVGFEDNIFEKDNVNSK